MTRRVIPTGAAGLNRLLRGGLQTGRLTDFYGESGAGKSQLAFDLTVRAIGSLRGAVMFVDTGNTFRPERVAEIAEANGFGADAILAQVTVFKPRSSLDQLTVPERVRTLAKAEPLLLVVVDPLTDLFLQDYAGDHHLMSRQSALARHVHALALCALRDQLAVMVTNGVRTRPREGVAEIAGSALRSVHLRVRLSRQGASREARITAHNRVDTARFRITPAGLTD